MKRVASVSPQKKMHISYCNETVQPDSTPRHIDCHGLSKATLNTIAALRKQAQHPTLARPKSATFTFQVWSTSRLRDCGVRSWIWYPCYNEAVWLIRRPGDKVLIQLYEQKLAFDDSGPTLRSRCTMGGVAVWRKAMPRAASNSIFIFRTQSSSIYNIIAVDNSSIKWGVRWGAWWGYCWPSQYLWNRNLWDKGNAVVFMY